MPSAERPPPHQPPRSTLNAERSTRITQRSTPIAFAAFALILILAPHLFTSSLALGMLTQMAYLIVICLSYNLLLGQGGMLSFGHAVYVGLAGFASVHVLNWSGARAAAGEWFIPVPLLPLVGALAGALLAAVLGYVCTRRSGTAFAMITLGVGELVSALALMLPHWFGGEGGIATDRVLGAPGAAPWGISFGPDLHIYYLAAAYCFVCTVLLYGFTRTPLGRMLNAVRDNPQRVAFIGYDSAHVRYLAFIVSGFFAGIGGALMVLHLEIISAMDSLGTVRSGGYLLFTFLGGVGHFFGPIIGAVLMVLATIGLSALTQAWMLYLGLVFLLAVMFVPGGVAGLLAHLWHGFAQGGARRWSRLAWALAQGLAWLGALAGALVLVEMLYHRQLASMGGPLHLVGLTLDVQQGAHWLCAALWCAAWAALALGLRHAARRTMHDATHHTTPDTTQQTSHA